MSWIFIQAEDAWFFRDTRSFGQGEDHLARCIFPPSPATVAGAIRSRIIGSDPHWDQGLFNQGQIPSLYDRIGKPGDLGPVFSMRGPFLARALNQQINCYCPIPLDAYVDDQSPQRYGALRPHHLQGLEANWPAEDISPLWPPEGIRKDAVEEPLWLSPVDFRYYQNGSMHSARPELEFFVREPRIGIGRDTATGTAKDKMLYSASFIRLQSDTGLLVWVADAVQLPQSGLLTLGGESRAARFRTIPNQEVRLLPEFITIGKQRLKLVLLTPAFIKRPTQSNWSTMGLPAGATLRAAALGRGQAMNGWDIAAGQGKTLRSYVPAGSVFYFEWNQPLQVNLDPSIITFTESPNNTSFDKLGFGQVAIANWDWQS